MVSADEDDGGLDKEVDGEAAKPDPISRRARCWRQVPVPDSSQITTVDAPISISESRPNPASATDRAGTAATPGR